MVAMLDASQHEVVAELERTQLAVELILTRLSRATKSRRRASARRLSSRA